MATMLQRIMQRVFMSGVGSLFLAGMIVDSALGLEPTVVEQGRRFYEQRQWAEAIATWQTALASSPSGQSSSPTDSLQHSLQHSLQQATVWSYIAMGYHKLGQWPEAREAIATSQQHLQALAEAPESVTESAAESATESATESAIDPIASTNPDYWYILAQTFNTQAQIEFAQGQPDRALALWQQTTQIYRDLNYAPGVTGGLINQAKALEVNGYYRRACQTVLEAIAFDSTSACDFSDFEQAESGALGSGQEEPEGSPLGKGGLRGVSARSQLNSIVHQLEYQLSQQSDPDLQLLGWRSVGNGLRRTGHIAEAYSFLAQAVNRAMEQNRPDHLSYALISLAQVEGDRYDQALFRYDQTGTSADRQEALLSARQALDHYQEASVIAQTVTHDALLSRQTMVQQIALLIQLYTDLHQRRDENTAEEFRHLLQEQLSVLVQAEESLPASRAAIYSQVNLAQSLIKLRRSGARLPETHQPSLPWLEQHLHQAYQEAISLQDHEAESYVLGTLGLLYEYQASENNDSHQWQQAQRWTTSALSLAQANQAWHIAYQWQWQLGRIYRHQGNADEALRHYQAAADSLQTVRQDLLAIESDVQFSFRDDVEPLYREWVALLVADSGAGVKANGEGNGSGNFGPSQARLQQAIEAVDALRLSELENFLSCNLTPMVELAEPQTDNQSAVIYPIILPDQLVVIVRSPHSSTLHFHRVNVAATEVEQTLIQFRREMQKRYISPSFFGRSQQVYDWLIRPFENILNEQATQTLVFVADGGLRNIPMAALHNGDRFLIEEYAIAISPGLQLPASEPLNQLRLGALTFGLSEIRQNFPPHAGFAALSNVETEISAIQDQLAHQTVLNQAFTDEALQTLIREVPFPIVHLATHGQFSSDPDNTFLLAWDQTITMDDLRDILQSRTEQNGAAIELLVLSACKTADGDNRATLGLAGVAIQSGARSTIASLWYIDDRSTSELMQRLYRELTASDGHISRAEALRRAQIDLLQTPGYQAPTYWAPYVLVGNWF